ncbi:facilitated trehalose transporter Tret1-like [Dermacentor andersoni]|uniref:facilitated trehalose transporter Tret1-like n=1 Tax=Dermacentor andersoni TaxID=34620 RepID=UPI003B3BA30B
MTACLLLHLLQNISCVHLCLLRALQLTGASVTDVSPQAFAMILLTLHIGLATLATFITKTVSRRGLLALSSVLVAGGLSILRPLDHVGFSDWALDKEDIIASWNGLLSVGLLVTAYSLGMCHVPVLLTGELIPLRLRYLTSSIVWASRWSLTFVLLHFDEDVISAFHNTGALLMLSVTVAVVAATAIALVPETEGRTLSEIERS